MRHRKSGRKLNRNSSHRKALFKNLSIAFIKQELIKTTLPKAKELRRHLEPLITMAKEDTVANRRHVFSKLRDDEAVAKLKSVYIKTPNIIFARYKLATRKQQPGEMLEDSSKSSFVK